MCEGYVLEWLDTLISVTLNPLKSEVGSIPPEDINKLQNLIIQEKDKVQSAIKFTVFNLNDETAIKCAIKTIIPALSACLTRHWKTRVRLRKMQRPGDTG